jgi:nicotinate-nucleotide pyrophosphorylase (carboxylating)
VERAVLPPVATWLPLVQSALDEDLGPGDATTPLVIEAGRCGRGVIEARQDLVVCGLEVAAAVFRCLDPGIAFEPRSRDGALLAAGRPLADVSGDLRALLAGERTALNFLARLCASAPP